MGFECSIWRDVDKAVVAYLKTITAQRFLSCIIYVRWNVQMIMNHAFGKDSGQQFSVSFRVLTTAIMEMTVF
jgi:hypothetical protein